MKEYSSESGTFTIWALGLCLTLFMLGGISIDVWRAFDARRSLNEISDLSARMAADQIDIDQRRLFGKVVLDSNSAKDAAKQSIIDNSNLQRISITHYLITIDTDTNEVHVKVHTNFSFFLLRMFPSGSDSDMSAESTARPFEG